LTHDALKTARALENKGFSREQWEALAEQLAESRRTNLSHLSTRDDLKFEITELKTALKAEIGDLKSSLKVEIAETKADLLKVIITVAVLELRAINRTQL
jgi:hypothetical protein